MRTLTALSIATSGLLGTLACTTDDPTYEPLDAGPEAFDAGAEGDAAPTTSLPGSDAATDTDPPPIVEAGTGEAGTVDAATVDAAMVDAAADASTLDAAMLDAATLDASLAFDASAELDATSPVVDAAADASTLPVDAAGLVDAATDAGSTAQKTVFDLTDVKTNPQSYQWFDFRPNVQKLILAGAPETEHIAILWYTVIDGAVGLHYHAKTESVYVIEGTQTDAKGVYPTGTVYFNPPESGHQITNSSGFFVLAYAAPPDFASTDLIQEYEPVTIDTDDPDLMSDYPFESQADGVSTYEVPLDEDGGLSCELIEVTTTDAAYEYTGNYVLVLGGECIIDGTLLGADTLVVTGDVEPVLFTLSAGEAGTCLAMAVSF